MNIAILCGRLGHTPELKVTPTGLKVANFNIATNYFYKDQQGQGQEGTDWHKCVAYGITAENIAKYFKGGDQMMVHGRIKTRDWQKEGEETKRYLTEVVVDRFEFGAKNMNRDDRQQHPDDDGDQSDDRELSKKSDGIDYPEEDINPEDIPF